MTTISKTVSREDFVRIYSMNTRVAKQRDTRICGMTCVQAVGMQKVLKTLTQQEGFDPNWNGRSHPNFEMHDGRFAFDYTYGIQRHRHYLTEEQSNLVKEATDIYDAYRGKKYTKLDASRATKALKPFSFKVTLDPEQDEVLYGGSMLDPNRIRNADRSDEWKANHRARQDRNRAVRKKRESERRAQLEVLDAVISGE